MIYIFMGPKMLQTR